METPGSVKFGDEISFFKDGSDADVFNSNDTRSPSPSLVENYHLAELGPELSAAGCQDLCLLIDDLRQRRLVKSILWVQQCLNSIFAKFPQLINDEAKSQQELPKDEEAMKLIFFHCALDMQNYGQVIMNSDRQTNCTLQFLRFYSKLKLCKTQRVHTLQQLGADIAIPKYNRDLLKIVAEMEQEIPREKMDAYLWLIYGQFRVKLGQRSDAMFCFAQAVKKLPRCFPAWRQLAKHAKSITELDALDIPTHWMKTLCQVEICIHKDSSVLIEPIFAMFEFPAFRVTPYFLSLLAEVKMTLKGAQSAIEVYKEIATNEVSVMPFVDEYAKALLTVGDTKGLAELSLGVAELPWESAARSVVIANYFSSHYKFGEMCKYATRAVALKSNDPNNWMLLGDACVELQQFNAAYAAYGRALALHKNEYKAWYAIGQIFHLLEYNTFSLYSCRQAYFKRTEDSKVVQALGDEYALEKDLESAELCYWKAYYRGDVDRIALLRLADLYSQIGEDSRAVSIYKYIVSGYDMEAVIEGKTIGRMYLYLASYYFNKGQYDTAHWYAVRLISNRQYRVPARELCRKIEEKLSNVGDSLSCVVEPCFD